MAFSFALWNVEHFKSDLGRMKIVADELKAAHPNGKELDVFGILEVESLNIVELITQHFPNYDFHLTDGPQVQEILIGVRRGVFSQKVFTQKREFKAGNEFLRPGHLVAVREASNDKWTQLLYLHTDSGTDASAFGNRFEMFDRVAKMRKALAKQAQENDRLIVLGDLNTMGLNYPKKSKIRVTGTEEITELATFTGMRLTTKDIEATWKDINRRIKDSNLDHVLVSPNLALNQIGTGRNGTQLSGQSVDIHSAGWPTKSDADRDDFVRNISDHAILVGETLD
jgi:Endonuclease/Exonuclease/phosphatase family